MTVFDRIAGVFAPATSCYALGFGFQRRFQRMTTVDRIQG